MTWQEESEKDIIRISEDKIKVVCLHHSRSGKKSVIICNIRYSLCGFTMTKWYETKSAKTTNNMKKCNEEKRLFDMRKNVQ